MNPLNWFGNSTPAPVAPPQDANSLIPQREGLFSRGRSEEIYAGVAIDTVSDLTIERVPGGAIIRATGLAARQGIYDVQLTPSNVDETAVDGVLIYRLEALRKPTTAQGAPATREVVVARKVTDQTLAGARTIRVEAARNALQSGR